MQDLVQVDRPLTSDELWEIAGTLDGLHKIFYVFWSLASPVFSSEVPTAAVRFAPAETQLLLNHEFWDKLNRDERMFIACHECCHVLLEHGFRNGYNVKGATPLLVNIAQDITINEMIVSLFGFNRADLRGWQRYCWIETCFEHPMLIERNQTYRYYLEKLIAEGKTPNAQLVDSHGDGGSATEKAVSSKLAKELAKELSADELGKVIDASGQDDGGSPGPYDAIFDQKVAAERLDLRKLIEKLKRSSIVEVEADMESFAKNARRFDSLLSADPSICLPGVAERQTPSKDRLLTAVFIDVSGSCVRYFAHFRKILAAFEQERETFDLRPFAFDYSVVDLLKQPSIKIGSGTLFHIIEEKVQELKTEYGRYPDAVFVVTDGEGDVVKPAKPANWLWLLTNTGSTSAMIPPGSTWKYIKDVSF